MTDRTTSNRAHVDIFRDYGFGIEDHYWDFPAAAAPRNAKMVPEDINTENDKLQRVINK